MDIIIESKQHQVGDVSLLVNLAKRELAGNLVFSSFLYTFSIHIGCDMIILQLITGSQTAIVCYYE